MRIFRMISQEQGKSINSHLPQKPASTLATVCIAPQFIAWTSSTLPARSSSPYAAEVSASTYGFVSISEECISISTRASQTTVIDCAATIMRVKLTTIAQGGKHCCCDSCTDPERGHHRFCVSCAVSVSGLRPGLHTTCRRFGRGAHLPPSLPIAHRMTSVRNGH